MRPKSEAEEFQGLERARLMQRPSCRIFSFFFPTSGDRRHGGRPVVFARPRALAHGLCGTARKRGSVRRGLVARRMGRGIFGTSASVLLLKRGGPGRKKRRNRRRPVGSGRRRDREIIDTRSFGATILVRGREIIDMRPCGEVCCIATAGRHQPGDLRLHSPKGSMDVRPRSCPPDVRTRWTFALMTFPTADGC